MKPSKLSSDQLRDISQITIADYNSRAIQFMEGTRDHDVTQNQTALLQNIGTAKPWHLLDIGCGPGRDLKSFSAMGHQVVGLDGSAEFCTLAREQSGCDVWQQDFLDLTLPDNNFDGIFANASLFHIPTQELARVLSELFNAMKMGGALLSSNPHGANKEGWQRQRYAAFHTPQQWQDHMQSAGFELIETYYRPAHLPLEQRPWLVTVWRKPHRGANESGNN